MIIWLGLGELAWLAYWLLRPDTATPAYLATVLVWIAAMLAWLVVAVRLGRRGFFLTHSTRFSNLVGVALVVTVGTGLFLATAAGREGVLGAAAGVPDVHLIGFHGLRLLAVGTVVKYVQRQLPLHFALMGSLPDVLFAVSAVVVGVLAANGPVSGGFLLVWHIVGLVTFLGAGVSMFFSVPSPWRVFHRQPDASLVFQFPMLLAPNFTVPLFMLAHLLAIAKLVAL
jgi:hypothetical protein